MASALARLFGTGKGKDDQPSPQVAIQKLRETEEMLGKKSEFLEKKIEKELAAAKHAGMKNKRAAMNALKRKKRLEKQLQQIDGTLSTIEFQREALENAQTNTEVLNNMSFAAKALKAAHQQLDVDDVQDMMDDIQEQNELSEEITNALSNPVGFGQDVDEDELLAELEGMEQEELEKDLLQVPAGSSMLPEDTIGVDDLPAVPTKTPKAKVKNDDDDLKELASWATS
ncbi:hypothetical protein EMCRGX_G031778 [Ephydatia muelleri]|eukprot:Em0018g227a